MVAIIAFAVWPLVTVAAEADEDEVLEALEQVRADPNISPEGKVRTLRWAGDDPEPKERTGSLQWLVGLFQWIAGISRLLLWVLIGLLIALLVLFITRVVRSFGPDNGVVALEAPTHVRELDIRPDSLPDDIGATALELWERNEHRPALSLLYRGLLSRLVHVHAVPIRESSTETECLDLAIPRLREETAQYASKLVRVWQYAVYGARDPASDEMRTLCARFANAFPAPADQLSARS